jgi:hypothetical protein
MTIHVNSGLKLYMESAIATATTITAITKAAPGVFSASGHTFANGDYVLLEVQGMQELNGQLMKVVNVVATTSFQVAGVDGVTGLDTSLYSTFTAGTAKKVTLGTSINGVQEFTFNGGEIKVADSTTVSDTSDKQVVVGATAQAADMVMQWDPTSAAQQAMRAAYATLANKGFKVVWPDGAWAAWYGTVGFTGAPGGGKQGVTTSPAKITQLGNLTIGAV